MRRIHPSQIVTAGKSSASAPRPSIEGWVDRILPQAREELGGELDKLPRWELAMRVGRLVSTRLKGAKSSLNPLERRNLVTAIVNALLPERQEPEREAETEAAKEEKGTESGGNASSPAPPCAPAEQAMPQQEDEKTAKDFNPISEAVARAKEETEALIYERLDVAAASRLRREQLIGQMTEIVAETLAERKITLNKAEQMQLVDLLLDDMLGFGPLEPLLADERVTDIMVNGPDKVYVERDGKLERTDVRFRNHDHVMNICTRIVSFVGRRVDESSPLVDARLPDGSRVNIIIPPLAIDGASISIRKFSEKKITLDVMARQQNMSEAMCRVLKIAARSRLNILISGGTGSGKTTLLNALSQMIDSGERIVTIEDAAELQLQQPHVVRLETRPPNLEGQGEITMRDLVKNALRMRPDRIILGEVRGSEAVDMLQAMNTGHDGSLGTIHANNPREALTRLENMISMAGINLPAKASRAQIASAIHMIVQVQRMRDGMRRITHITEVVGMEGDIITTQDLFTYVFEGEDGNGKLKGHFQSSGLRPHFTPEAAYFGLDKALLEAVG